METSESKRNTVNAVAGPTIPALPYRDLLSMEGWSTPMLSSLSDVRALCERHLFGHTWRSEATCVGGSRTRRTCCLIACRLRRRRKRVLDFCPRHRQERLPSGVAALASTVGDDRRRICSECDPASHVYIDTVNAVLTFNKTNCEDATWTAAGKTSREAASRWLRLRVGVSVLDVRPPTRVTGRPNEI